LCFMRQYSGDDPYSHALVSEEMVDNRTFFSSKGIIQQAPLYLYDTDQKKKGISFQTMMLFEPKVEYGKSKGKRANIAQEVFEQLKNAYGKVPTPEQILGYCYAVLYSNTYREKYAEFLKIDFPRIPFTKNYELFKEMSGLGNELIELHLLKHKSLNNPIVKYRGKGTDDTIERPVYDEEKETVHINEHRYFENVSPEVWNYQIGGYKVLDHYLKDRKGRQMDDAGHYCKMGTSIAKTIDVQKEIDKLFPKVEKRVIEG
jgi:predicted helicase